MAIGNAIVGALRVVLGADTAQFEQGLKSAQKSLSAFSAGVAKVATVAAAGLSVAGIGLGIAIKGAVDNADKLAKMSQKVGVPIEELSALKLAAELADVSIDELAKGLGKLSKTAVEAAAKPMSEQANAFRALGISVTDAQGKLKSSGVLLEEIAEKFAGLKDGTGKTAVAMHLFGRAGADLIPLLNGGKEGIAEARREMELFGGVITNDVGKAAEQFNDNLRRIGTAKDAIVLKITEGLLPALNELALKLVNVAKDGTTLKEWGETIGKVFAWVSNEVQMLGLSIGRLAVEWEAFKKIFSVVPFTEAARKAWADFIQAGDETSRVLKEARNNQGLYALADAFGPVGAKATEAAKGQREFNYSALEGKNAITSYIDSLKKKQAALTADLQTIGMTTAAQEKLKIQLEAQAIADANRIKLQGGLKVAVDAAAQSYANMTQRVEEAKQRFDAFKDVVLSVRSSLENAFVDAITQAKSLKDVISSLIKEFAKLAAQMAFRAAFGDANSWASAAGSLFSGGLKLPGFATGGAFNVGGAGGIDSQVVAFRATPGEHVRVSKGSDGMRGGLVYAPVIDARGADAAAVARLAAVIEADKRTFNSRVLEVSRRHRTNNPGSFG